MSGSLNLLVEEPTMADFFNVSKLLEVWANVEIETYFSAIWENILTQIQNSLHSRNQYFRVWFGYLAASQKFAWYWYKFEWLPLHSTHSLLVDFSSDEILGNFPQLFANHRACKIWGWLPCWTNSNVSNDIVWHRRRAGWGHVVHIPHRHTSEILRIGNLFRSQNMGSLFPQWASVDVGGFRIGMPSPTIGTAVHPCILSNTWCWNCDHNALWTWAFGTIWLQKSHQNSPSDSIITILEAWNWKITTYDVEPGNILFYWRVHYLCSLLNVRMLLWGFPKIVVPQNGWFIIEIPIKMDDLGGNPAIFGNIHL